MRAFATDCVEREEPGLPDVKPNGSMWPFERVDEVVLELQDLHTPSDLIVRSERTR